MQGGNVVAKDIVVLSISLLIGYFIGVSSIKNEGVYIDRKDCSWADIDSKVVLLNNKIPAKIITPN